MSYFDMTYAEAVRQFKRDYWEELFRRHKTARAVAEHAQVNRQDVYKHVAQTGAASTIVPIRQRFGNSAWRSLA